MALALFIIILSGANIADSKTNAFNGGVNKATFNTMNAAGQGTHDVLNGAIKRVKGN
jgi:hypothetical protein